MFPMEVARFRKTKLRQAAAIAAALAGTLFVLGEARAGFTSRVSSPPKGEQGVAAILGHSYRGKFTATNGSDFTNGTLTAVRVEDSTADNDPLSVRGAPGPDGGTSSDQFWAIFNGEFSARALARFAGKAQTFGYVPSDSIGSEASESAAAFQRLFNVRGSGYNVTGSSKHIDLVGETWSWARSGGGDTFTSAEGTNGDSRDHVITYRIDGLDNNRTTWALFWEDLDAGRAGHASSMSDFNDLVVEVSAPNALSGGSSSVAAPLPPAAWSGLAMLSGMGLFALKPVKRWFRSAGRPG